MDLWIFTCVNEVGKFLVYFDGGVDGVGCRDPNCLFKDRVCFDKQELMEPQMDLIHGKDDMYLHQYVCAHKIVFLYMCPQTKNPNNNCKSFR